MSSGEPAQEGVYELRIQAPLARDLTGGHLAVVSQADGARMVEDLLFQAGIETVFDLKRAGAGVQDTGFEAAEFDRGETHRVGGGLAVNEGFTEGRR